MNRHVSFKQAGLVSILILTLLSGCASTNGIGSRARPKVSPETAHTFEIFTLPALPEAADRDYLGVSQEPFKLTQVKTRLLLIETYSMYCPHCQREAPLVNALYDLIRQKGLADRIKIIGIAAGDSQFEVETFKKQYNVPFPLFKDEDLSKTHQMGVKRTPTFLAIRIDEDGSHRHVLFHPGRMETPGQFLETLRRLSDF
ncbi:MAG: redoxin domain-containing protein [Desulfobacterales bacterium]|nr:redoxin domain-containing protein [Desulfobacterales bacterium]